MWRNTLFAAAVALQAVPAPQAPVPEAPPLHVVVAAPVYHPDGAVTSEMATMAVGAPSQVYLFSRRSVCESAAAGDTRPADAGFGWRVSTHIVRATARDVVVSVDWQRLWDRGQTLKDGPAGAVQLTLHPGDRIPLDHISNRGAESCRAVGMGLEVRVARPAASLRVSDAGPLGLVVRGEPMTADLWLVHTSTASGVQRAVHQAVRLVDGRGTFSFAAVPLSTPGGDVGVSFMGSIVRYRAQAGQDFLLVSLSRLVSGAMLPDAGVTDRTSSLMALRRPDEVIALEMPTVPAGGGGTGGGGGGGRGTRIAAGRGGAGGSTAGSATTQGAGGTGAQGSAAAVPRGVGARERVEGQATVATRPIDVSRFLAGEQFALRLRVAPEK